MYRVRRGQQLPPPVEVTIRLENCSLPPLLKYHSQRAPSGPLSEVSGQSASPVALTTREAQLLLASQRVPADIRTRLPDEAPRIALSHTPRHGAEGMSELALMGQRIGRVRTNKAWR
jgi:hypothetical protein